MADCCTLALTVSVCALIWVIIFQAFGISKLLERIAAALERIADALEQKHGKPKHGKLQSDPCKTCLRWPECHGVDREYCRKMCVND